MNDFMTNKNNLIQLKCALSSHLPADHAKLSPQLSFDSSCLLKSRELQLTDLSSLRVSYIDVAAFLFSNHSYG